MSRNWKKEVTTLAFGTPLILWLVALNLCVFSESHPRTMEILWRVSGVVLLPIVLYIGYQTRIAVEKTRSEGRRIFSRTFWEHLNT